MPALCNNGESTLGFAFTEYSRIFTRTVYIDRRLYYVIFSVPTLVSR